MIKIEKTQIVGLEPAIRGMRNPKNSWDNSDSEYVNGEYVVGEKDLKLANVLANAGTDHGKFLRMIVVYADITAPLYWWKEFDTYKVGTVANSCSTMHKIQSKKFTRDDFSIEHLNDESLKVLDLVIYELNKNRDLFNMANDKDDWWQMIQLLPSSYNQKRTVMVSYAVLRNMYHGRYSHKLDCWRIARKWMETLPHSELITGVIDA